MMRNVAGLSLSIGLLMGCGAAPQPAMPPDPSLLAAPGAATANGAVDGIQCESSEQLLFHIHSHLAVFVDGGVKLIPGGVGIGPPLEERNGVVLGGSCFSWLHTHDRTGILHIESPVTRVYTLGNFFHVWGQPLSATQVGPATGKVTAFLNGQPFAGDPATIPMDDHNVIQLDVGTPVIAAQPYTFPQGY